MLDDQTFAILFFLFHIVIPFLVVFGLYLWKGYHK
jgi:hypothetical protein